MRKLHDFRQYSGIFFYKLQVFLNLCDSCVPEESQRVKLEKWNVIFPSPLAFLICHPHNNLFHFSLPLS
jgi:hypothetical protein